ncbi:hypothetical protein H4R27_000646 [Coemansia aciculifera]|uniref:Lysozyme n=1 Tax=Coemansia pectinata TaxID=1052879 RepID=A0A9W8GVB2_9FUNG|nr:hypothetical protein GGI19_002875 [Coemansia pectinata]KAJ2886436.1 hypothetical protein H4R27_000646 [Coemansia aciculifera]
MGTFILFTIFAIYVAGAAAVINCRASPNDSALAVVIYGEKAFNLLCRTTGALTVNRTTQWLRTGDDCYVPSYYINIDEDTKKMLPECAKLDAKEPCTLPNQAGFDLIQHYEGFLDRPHTDTSSGLTYIGYGHQCTSAKCDQEPVEIRKFPISKMQGNVLLWHDLHKTTACLADMLADDIDTTPLKLSENMWSALVSWTFSTGCDLAAKSQLVARIRHGESPVAVVAAELPKWTVIHGMSVSDLTYRREAELTLFRTRSPHLAYPRCIQK